MVKSPKRSSSASSKRPRTEEAPSPNTKKKAMDESGPVGQMSVSDLRSLIVGVFESRVANLATKDDVESIKEEMARLVQENAHLRSELATVKKECEDMRKEVDECQIQIRKKNLLFFGLRRKPNDNCAGLVKQLCNEVLQTQVSISQAYPLGKISNMEAPVLAEFASATDIANIFGNVKNLKDTSISIQPDLPITVRRTRGILLQIRKELKKHKPEMNAQVRNATLIVDGKTFRWSHDTGLTLNGKDGAGILSSLARKDLTSYIKGLLDAD
ncbi:Hypothetical protein NTJ_10888 [Nesidiocoris tenuis]|uniref:Uncharacterized protein n=1 Tax=Nesidiocoris tenuis TaxID=355587 RepID=A0ABN7B1F7_9HEMI|nr:Hypothetical protein NTJ_10888 [Nesidiocoris tenuis]